MEEVEGVEGAPFSLQKRKWQNRSTPEIVKGAVQWSSKVDQPLPRVSNELYDDWLGNGRCFDAAASSESRVMVDAAKKREEGRAAR